MKSRVFTIGGILFLGVAAAVIALVSLISGEGALTKSQPVEAQTTERPNFVFVMTDDLDERAMQDLGGIRTLMGSNGTTFNNAYVTYSFCCPSRATIFRGQYPHNHHIVGNSLDTGGGEKKFRQLDGSTVATWLNNAGYRTKLIGKYMNSYTDLHVPPGWDEWFALKQEGGDFYDAVNENGHWTTLGGQHSADVFADKASDFIRRSSTGSAPFFAMVNTIAPHTPPEVASRYQDRFTSTPLPKPPNFNEDDVSDKPAWVRARNKASQTQIDNTLPQEYRNRLRSMLSVEDLLRQIIATLQETDELKNTYIFFTSDNGYHLGNHRLWLGKRAPYEEDIGVPLMVRGPGVPAGAVRDQLVLNNDFAPTMADLAGASTPSFVDGRSFAPLLTGSPPTSWRQAFLEEGWGVEGGTQVRTPTHKGVHTQDHMFIEYDTKERELYDLDFDPYQLQSKPRAGNVPLYSALETRLYNLRDCSGAACRTAEWTSDATAPRVTSTSPAANAVDVSPSANLTATFSENMQASSVNATTFELLQRGTTTQVGATVTYSASTRKATLDPTNALQRGVTYDARLTTEARDLVGNHLDQNSTSIGLQQKVWSFAVSN